MTCYKCQKTGHDANGCPEAKNGNGNESFGKKPNPFNRGQVNHVNVEEVEAHPDAVIGKFLVKSFTVVVLLILVHRIHTYQGDLWISISCPPKFLVHLC